MMCTILHCFKINTALRTRIKQLADLIFYSCKSKLDCWSLFCSLSGSVLSSNREGGRCCCRPMTGRHSSVVSSSPEMKQQTTCQHNQITKQAVLVLMYPTLYLPYCGHHVGSHDDCTPFPVIPLRPCTNYMFVNIFRAVKEADIVPVPVWQVARR